MDGYEILHIRDGRSRDKLHWRIEQLEQLCRGMYMMHTLEQHWQGAEPFEDFTHSMKELGLLEGEQND